MEQTPSLPSYPTDLNDLEWAVVDEILGGPPKLGRPPRFARRAVLGAIFYMVRTGGFGWRLLPHDLPPWRFIVYYYFARWRAAGLFEKLHDALRDAARIKSGKKPPRPRSCWIARACWTTRPGGGVRGYDAGKKIVGRKRHLLVDTEGLIFEGPRARRERARSRRGQARWFLIRSTRHWPNSPTHLGRRRLRPEINSPAGWPNALGSALLRLEIVRRNDAPASTSCRGVLGGRAHLRLAQQFPPSQQGLRVPHRLQRSLHLPRGFFAPHRTPRLALRLSVHPLRDGEISRLPPGVSF